MMARKKAPAYAKPLIENRRRGFHPLSVDVIYGDDWSLARDRARMESAAFVRLGAAARPYAAAWEQMIGGPVLAVRPRDFAPGVFDWHCLAGVRVRVVDDCRAADDWDGNEGDVSRWGNFYYLLGEIGRSAAEVLFLTPTYEQEQELSLFASAVRLNGRGALRWPDWWSADDDAGYCTRQSGLYQDISAVYGARFARANGAATMAIPGV